uniref:Uncharacterized protein n=1 Tax=Arundo donax TaxID=35708 RepID=A0A0A9CMW7_ARUDO
MPDNEIPDVNGSQRSHRQHVSPEERQALLASHNEHFAMRRDKKTSASIEEMPAMSADGVNGEKTPT